MLLMESWKNKMGKLKYIDSLTPQRNEVYLFDTCILMYNFYTAGSYRKPLITKCNNLYTKIVKADAKILIYPELMQEFFNLFIKTEYQMYLKKHELKEENFQYKEFRRTSEFSDVVAELKGIYQLQIKPYAITTSSMADVDDIFNFLDFITEMDFNDMLLCKVAKANNAKLVSHDSDFILSSLVNSVDFYFAQS